MKKILIAVAIVALLVVCWRWSAAIPQDLDPLNVAADTHKLVFENRFVRVLEVHVPPGKTEPGASMGGGWWFTCRTSTPASPTRAASLWTPSVRPDRSAGANRLFITSRI
jgi:hypothetical protein